jgi:SAM-dependent methyltransferase
MMLKSTNQFEDYFSHLQKISFLGRIYKKFFSSPILYFCARRFGKRIVEIGSGTGSGALGAFSKHVQGLEINPIAVEYCKMAGLNAQLIKVDESFPVPDAAFDVCILDNVLEHIEHPQLTLDECFRITKADGGLVIAVPGRRGFESDTDHKIFYDAEALKQLDERWTLQSIFSTPFLFRSEGMSRSVRQYCLVAVYIKK